MRLARCIFIKPTLWVF